MTMSLSKLREIVKGQGSLACCSPWGCKEWDMTQQLNTYINNVCIGLPLWLSSKESTCNAGDAGDICWIPGLGKFPGGGHGNPLKYSCLENPMDRGAWQATVHKVTKSRTPLKWLSTNAHMCIAELLCCNLKSTQYCKSTIFQQQQKNCKDCKTQYSHYNETMFPTC